MQISHFFPLAYHSVAHLCRFGIIISIITYHSTQQKRSSTAQYREGNKEKERKEKRINEAELNFMNDGSKVIKRNF
jgi:hypothetical protein